MSCPPLCIARDHRLRSVVCPLIAAAACSVLPAVLRGAEAFAPPDFDLFLSAPATIGGSPLSPVEIDAEVMLDSTRTDPQSTVGAQGWTLSIVTGEGARIIGATTSGTAADAPPVGYLSEGFELTLVTSGAGNEGAISAVALSFRYPISLPADGRAKLLRIAVETDVPAAGEDCRPVRLDFKDGLRGSGGPVNNTITYRGQTRKDDGSAESDHDADKEEGSLSLVCAQNLFLRGNCSQDSDVDLSDAIFALGYLFLGGPRPPCLVACDANDDEKVDIADPIYTLNHLFCGGPPLPAPSNLCGVDPSPGRLSCEQTNC